MEKLFKKLDEVIKCITNSNEYKNCILYKDKMSSNSEINDLVKKLKILQKKYVKSNYDSSIKKELDDVSSRLNNIPIYNMYLTNLEKVNYKIEYVKDSLNDYFYNLLNKKY